MSEELGEWMKERRKVSDVKEDDKRGRSRGVQENEKDGTRGEKESKRRMDPTYG